MLELYRVSLGAAFAGATGLVGALLLYGSAYPVDLLNVGPPENPYHTVDTPVYLLYAEAVAYLLVTTGAVIVATVSRERAGALALAIVVAVAWVSHLATALWRALHLFSDAEGFCGDARSVRACPATRLQNRTIADAEVLGGDCVFWYWGAMQPRSTVVSTNADLADVNLHMLELMDWSRPASYGWAIIDGAPAYGGERLREYQDEILALKPELLGADKFTTAPDIAHCWYWGCHPVCNEPRFAVNRTMLAFTAIWAVVEVVLFGLLVTIYRGGEVGSAKDKDEEEEEDAKAAVAAAEALEEAARPLMRPQRVARGRRLRF
jgi:hypothetical protein